MRRMWLPLVLSLGVLLPRAEAGKMSCKEVLARCYDACIERQRGRDNMQQCLVTCGLHFKMCEHETARAAADAGTPPADAGTVTVSVPPSRHPAPPPEPAGPDLSEWDPDAR